MDTTRPSSLKGRLGPPPLRASGARRLGTDWREKRGVGHRVVPDYDHGYRCMCRLVPSTNFFELPDGRRVVAIDDEIALIVPAGEQPLEDIRDLLCALIEAAIRTT
jgi:hypothetical protein